MNKIRTLFRRGAAFLLAAALVAPGFGFPAVSAAQDGAVASYDPAVRSVTVNTYEARYVRESVDLASLPEEAQRALAGYTVVAVDEGGDSIQLVTAYRYGLLEGGMIACD